mgnify:CR=1 FL=1
MKLKLPDIDIDVADRHKVLENFDSFNASLDGLKKHNTGVYFTDIPVNPITNTSSIDYKEAEDRGYFKLDILNVGVYENVKNETHLVELVTKEPDWSLLEHKEIVEQLFHIHNHFDIVNTLKPKSVEQLASVLAIIRPAKRHLAKQNWNEIEVNVWKKPTDGTYFFKKSHAVGYAMAIVLQLNLLTEQAKTE